ncbi:MAG: tRNA pseudouridine(38-40) synthase TruA [Verrucomicrobia bacterium]|nr:tRNA pseudouridine(38-40) synthase TruA [Verrucomicrobiota bacterium]MCF7709328.1 tRNA pseudouridine(38-40) synthase TruA [Verrucomicrobiota bacterium]
MQDHPQRSSNPVRRKHNNGWRTFKLVIAYDGTRYAGWQWQKGQVSVQEKIEQAVFKLFPGADRIHGSSRTDAGVHALGMTAHMRVPKDEFRMPVARLRLALNAFLPSDIRVMSAVGCRHDFHARFDATGKQYRYYVWNHPVMNPLLRHQAWHIPKQLNLREMRKAAREFIGCKDFKAFASAHDYEIKSTIRTVVRCDIRRSGHCLVFIIEGDGFLYKMCRGIVGTLVHIGQGRFSPEDVSHMLSKGDRRDTGMNAPAKGLVLWKVYYRKAVNRGRGDK